MLGASIRRLLAEARGNPRLTRAQIPTRRREVLAAADRLDELATQLVAPGPVAARGVAQSRLLLTDGSSPLYHARATEQLLSAITRALDGLRPAFGW